MKSRYRQFGFVVAAVILGVVVRVEADSPLSPEAAIADFQVPAGLRVELVAAEPEVVDPIAIAFDEDGRLWVVEMRDYPTLPPEQKPSSRIRVLRDLDDDGSYESATTFADGLLFPTGLQPWRGGVIVTLAGEVAYFPDDDLDDRADEKQVWYRGFATQNEQLRANHPTLGMDGLVYVAGGLRGGEIVNLRDPKATAISINGRDFAFDPITGRCEAVTGNGQFGLTLDERGRRYTCSNRNPLVQVMIEQRYLKQNPQLVLPAVVHDVAVAGDDSRIYPRTRALTTANSHAGQFTAACGVEILQGERLPNWFQNNAFICEPTANLVHREEINSFSVAFSSRPIPDSNEFLTSTDDWFRPVDLANGPDGALYVVDMYRAVIEHPHWMPEELRTRADLRHGNDRGRIYRIVGEPYSGISLPIDRNPRALVQLLKHRNVWQRETAARLIRESGTADSQALRDLVLSKSSWPGTREQALWLLEFFNALDELTLSQAFSLVREQALVLAESRLSESNTLREAALELSNEGSSRVRYQLALSLSFLPAESIVEPLQRIALSSPTEEWTCRAVALASRDQAATMLSRVLHRATAENLSVEKLRPLIAELSTATVATGSPTATTDLLSKVSGLSEPLARELLLVLATATEARGASFAPALRTVEQKHSEAHAAIVRLFDSALSTVDDESTTQAVRLEALRLLHHDLRPNTTETLLRLVSHKAPATQSAAVEALVGRATLQVVKTVLEAFPEQLPSVRRASLDLLLATNESALALLQAVESERVSAADIDALRAERLLQHGDATVRSLAERLLGARSADRGEVLQRYQSALSLAPDRPNGRKVFAVNCAACHRLAGEGTAIGPDIGDAALRTPAQLLADILQPNLAADANYVAYTAVTHAGRVHQGVIRTESDEGIVLQTAEGKSITIPRKELESLHSSGTSLMPDGLERQISPQHMADLIGYLRNWREMGNPEQFVSTEPPSPLASIQEVACEGSYPKHLQGVCANGKDAIYWCFTTVLVKTDLKGKLLVKVPVADHHGDLCYRDGKVYIAVNLGEFNQPAGRADSWVYVYDADSLKELERHAAPQVVHGAGGIAYHDDRFIVVGGLPDDVGQNYLYEYDDAMTFKKRQVLDSGHTHLGIQTAAYHDGHWWFGCYGQPPQLLKTDESFKMLGRWDFDCSLGIVGLKPGELLVANGKKLEGGLTGRLQRAMIDKKSGLRRTDAK